MSALSFARVARRAVGMSPQPEYSNLETLLEMEAGEVHADYRVLARVLPPIVSIVGLATFVPIGIMRTPLMFLGALAFLGIAAGLWFLLDRLDMAIPRSKMRLRKLAEPIWKRYGSVLSVVGMEPAISPSVAALLDEASGIYLRHSAGRKQKQREFGDSYERAIQALEEAMVKLLQLAEPAKASTQELELGAGWAEPLLQEMREMDRALDLHQQTTILTNSADPLIGLREARLELKNVESALRELEH